jgi:hypothetical protein
MAGAGAAMAGTTGVGLATGAGCGAGTTAAICGAATAGVAAGAGAAAGGAAAGGVAAAMGAGAGAGTGAAGVSARGSGALNALVSGDRIVVDTKQSEPMNGHCCQEQSPALTISARKLTVVPRSAAAGWRMKSAGSGLSLVLEVASRGGVPTSGAVMRPAAVVAKPDQIAAAAAMKATAETAPATLRIQTLPSFVWLS